MSDRPFADQERELLTELAALFAHRAEQDRSLASRLAEGLAGAQTLHQTTIAQARAGADEALAKATGEHHQTREKILAASAARIAGATKAMKAEVGTFRDQTQGTARAIAKKLEEAKWLAETLFESGQGRARAAFETARKAVSQRRTELDTLEKDGRSLLEKGGYAALSPAPGASEPDSGPAPKPGELDLACEMAQRATDRLVRSTRPFLLRPLGAVLVLIAGAAVGAGIGGGRAWLEPAQALPHSLPHAGFGAAGALVLLLLCRPLMRRRVRPAAESFAAALAHARTVAALSLRGAASTRDTELAGLEAKSYQEWADARASVAPAEAEIEARNTQQEPALKAKHEQVLETHRTQRDKALEEIDRKLAERRAAIESQLAAAIAAADRALAESRRSVEESDRAGRAALRQDWTTRIAGALERAESLAGVGRSISPPWDDPRWESVGAAASTPAGVRFGSLQLDLSALPGGVPTDPGLALPGPSARPLPLMIDLLGRGSVLIRATPDERIAAIDILNNIVLRLLTALPPGKARFTFVDPVGLGQSFAGLMHLSDYEEAIVGERIWTDPRQIEQRLTDLTEHMETVIQKYLRNEYETIQAYNAEAGEVAEPYRFLVIADFPGSITETAAKRLASIATSGARCGVFTLVMTTQPPPRAADAQKRGAPAPAGPIPWAELERHSMVLHLGQSGARWAEEPFRAWPVELERAPSEIPATRLLHQIGALVKDSTRVQVPFEMVEPGPDALWSGDATSEIRLPLGRAGAKKLQYLSLGRGTAQHALIAGRTGSGKSTLLHVIITTAALWYSPDQVELYLVDFKKGVEFKTYATHRVPHARVVAVESEREFGLSVLHRLDSELTRRGELFRRAGVQDLAGFRRWQSQNADTTSLPRILLVVDEFQEFFVEDDKLAQEANLFLDRLVRQGRAFGIHVVLGSQTLGGAYTLARSTLGQMAVRIALQCSEADSYLIMSEDNLAPRLLSRPGEAVYNDASGLVEANSPFQIVWLPDDARDTRLDRVSAAATKSGRRTAPQVVFEGNIPADPSRTHPLIDLLDRRSAATTPTLWLGEPLAIKDPTGILLHRQSAANTLMVGNHDEQATAMSASAMLSLAAFLRSAENGEPAEPGVPPAITLFDAAPPDLPHADLLPRLVRGLGPLARLVPARSVKEALADLGAEIDRRDASGLTNHPSALLVIHGLHRFRDLRKPADFSFSSEPGQGPTGSELFLKVLRSGPPVGVHTLLWCDTATNLDRTLERSALRDFNTRVLMQMSAGDSTGLIETQQGAALGRHRALLYSDDTGTIEKFRPYALPPAEWLDAVLARLGAPVRA